MHLAPATAPELVVLPTPPLTGRSQAPRSEWTQFIIPNGPFSPPPPDQADAGPRRPAGMVLKRDRSAALLRNASIGLCALSAAAAAVSFTAQYRMVDADRHLAVVAALVFACLSTTLALHGRRAFRARTLNVALAGASVFMNMSSPRPPDGGAWRSG